MAEGLLIGLVQKGAPSLYATKDEQNSLVISIFFTFEKLANSELHSFKKYTYFH